MKRHSVWAGALALMAAAGTAAAQAKVEGDLTKPMGKVRARSAQGGGQSGQSIMSLNQSDGDQTFEVRIVDGEVESAKLNGKSVPKDRIRQSDNKVEILDGDGNVIHTFNVGRGKDGMMWLGDPEGLEHLYRLRQIPGFGHNGEMFFTPGEAHAPPKVMLGINMGQPDEETAKEHEINADEAILVSKVIEGLPAAEAGLKEGDIIVRIAGKSPATPDRLREILKDKDPGDTVKVTVVREGDEKTLTIKLAEYDAEKLGVQHMKIEPFEAFGEGGPSWWDDDARKHFEEAMKGFKRDPDMYRWQTAPEAAGRGFIFRTPGPGGQGGPPGQGQWSDRLSELDGRMAEIDRRLSELNERLERLTQKLEKLNEGRP
jgi:hypothetical protein